MPPELTSLSARRKEFFILPSVSVHLTGGDSIPTELSNIFSAQEFFISTGFT
jgi:hypothetical protein